MLDGVILGNHERLGMTLFAEWTLLILFHGLVVFDERGRKLVSPIVPRDKI
jgi:hypothetical protein